MPEETQAFIQSNVRLDRDAWEGLLARFVNSDRKSPVPDTATIDALVLVKHDHVVFVAPEPHSSLIKNRFQLLEETLVDWRIADVLIAAEQLMVAEENRLARSLVSDLVASPIRFVSIEKRWSTAQ